MLAVLLGEDRLNAVRARRGRLNWREPRPPSVTGIAGATFPRREGESSVLILYVLLGEDRLSEARARRERGS